MMVGIIDSGIDVNDPRMAGADIQGWSIELGATGHALLRNDFHDENGHGTNIAAAVRCLAPDAKLIAVKIMGQRLRATAELMAAGIETAAKHGCRVINLSLGTPNMGKALLLRDCCHNAVETGAVVLAAAHPKGERAYPADLPEAVGVASHNDTPIDKFFYFDPKKFNRKQWGFLSAKFLAFGYDMDEKGRPHRYRGPGFATAYMSGRMVCLAEGLPRASPADMVKAMRRLALRPSPELGYS
jgi:subtilisin family serine protease